MSSLSKQKQRLSAKWSVRPRLILSVLLAGLVTILLPNQYKLPTRILCGWDAGMICFLGWSLVLMFKSTPHTMRYNAQRQDEGRAVILSVVLAAACASVLAIVFILRDTQDAPPEQLIFHVLLSITTIVGSWLLVHTIFALHYAHKYYQDGDKEQPDCKAEGLDFPEDAEPDYWDFLYFSFVIGMTSQVSDVQVTSRSIRRLALMHSILSFFFNTAIVAMSINILAGLVQKK